MISAAHLFADPALRHPMWIVDWSDVQDPSVLYCSLALFVSGVLCSAAGIGGGGIYVVVLMIVGVLSPHNAVPLSKAVVFFGSLATLALNCRRMWSPQKNNVGETVIDFHTVRVVVPAALGGTFLGVLLNWHAEGYAIVVMLALILVFMTAMVGRTAWQQYQSEELESLRSESSNPPELHNDETEPLVPNSAKLSKAKMMRATKSGAFTTQDVLAAVGLEALVVLCGALRFHLAACHDELIGQGSTGSCTHPLSRAVFGDQMGSWMSDAPSAFMLKRLVTFLPLFACLLAAVYVGRSTVQSGEWQFADVVSYQVMAVATGLFAGLVGVGGGLVFSPFFLLMGLEPAAAVATSSTCVLFTSSSTTFQYLLTDRVIMSLALTYGLVTAVASYFGTSLVHSLQDSFKGRRSYVTMIVAFAVALSAVLSMVKVVTILTEPSASSVVAS